ncbi:MAG: glutamine synthetase III [Lachnospiraceae bacterium]|nr:glutamine synthetase III [Lachnospiraceae bacterium]
MGNVISEIFGIDTFDDRVMKERLEPCVYEELRNTMSSGNDLAPEVAEAVAAAMRDWAVERGATHYAHWFQPMTGTTAGKQDSFVFPSASGNERCIMEFSGKELIKGESDASSFPSGGIRSTFEARGYTAWDCTSPAFLLEDAGGIVLCIPTAFCSYNGDALDKKTPLLRSMEAIDRAAVRLLHAIGRQDVNRVYCNVGPEQEYFLIDRKKYLRRDDLIFTGRTLFGTKPPKGQELDDHYFGLLKERVSAYMGEVNRELWKLGIFAKTQHNEAAPAQHELAQLYAEANIACDSNQLTMEVMKKVAIRHDLACLLAEKPFAGVNGSGKHNNWSLSTDAGENLFKPGKAPHENIQFLLFLAAVIQAVDRYPELLRLSASTPGNDRRLGGAEAPPAIISVFVGSQLEDILDQFAKTGDTTSSKKGGRIDVGVHALPQIKRDATDRNRTSPFAFTGNKFEFRSVGASQSIADANVVINTTVAESLDEFSDILETADDKEACAKRIIADAINNHGRVIFSGDGYSGEWREEARRRGLVELLTMVDAIPAWVDEKSVRLFAKEHVLSETELKARAEIYYESYSKTINIEAETMVEMASRQFIPASIRFASELAKSITYINSASTTIGVGTQERLLTQVQDYLADAESAVADLKAALERAREIHDEKDKAVAYRDDVVPVMDRLRKPIDSLETIVDKRLWPVPTYGDLLFEV